ncbi:MAG: hypothetical protein HUU03_10915 [Planctomycetaceae bacterium]|nr:hypothetical protein [Planctomycetota bacterium]MCQ3949332.1 hypothetical protein [Planctomycetota bacterium]NUO16938.1 hypothetical protein [Planctomycetaceae bacterium]GIK53558.1 MAG: hypothetical protein BroJett014_25310 [Planctomycetota bacterium]HRJ78401.1 hypothetical protein [Planctomycetota bacterium]
MRIAALLVLSFGLSLYGVACTDDPAPAPQPRPAPSSGIIPMSSISEAQKAEAIQNIGQLKAALQSRSVTPYNRDLNKLSRDVSGTLSEATAQKLGFASVQGFNGQWYKASDYAIAYMGGGKFLITAGQLNQPNYISEEVLIR